MGAGGILFDKSTLYIFQEWTIVFVLLRQYITLLFIHEYLFIEIQSNLPMQSPVLRGHHKITNKKKYTKAFTLESATRWALQWSL